MMWISYSDSEVNKFHPVCEKALIAAIKLIGKTDIYDVIHHQFTGSLEMDYCVRNKNTGKYLCVIEVKRTPSAVQSSRYQFQAMSYVQMNAGNNEKPFYILTNLECAFAFRYDPLRPKVFQQILKPGLVHIGKFNDLPQLEFEQKLTAYFKTMLQMFCDDSYEYLVTLEDFANHMEKLNGNPKKWKSHLAVLLYEYIRGALDCVNRTELKDVRLFKESVELICNEASRINFKDIFSYSPELFEDKVNIANDILINLYELGNQNTTGDTVADLLHQLVSSGLEHDGEVPTDLELGKLIAELTKDINGNLSDTELICDPAAGSGNLISSAIDVFGLAPNQILVNDINPKLLELLSLRLGLNFAKSVCQSNSPTIENKNIADLDRAFFDNVKILVMNPPFIAGINCVDRKRALFTRIEQLTEHNAISNVGQMPFEGAFLELITNLLADGATIACIFPKTHLMARGIEAQTIRRIIINNLGIHTIFLYPGNEIFNDVTKNTCVLIGKVRQPDNNVRIISCYDKIPDIDTHKFANAIKVNFDDEFTQIMPGVVAKRVPIHRLINEIGDGWRELNSEIVEAVKFVNDNFNSSPLLVKLSSYKYPLKRGTAGNNGASDLLFFDSRADLYNQYRNHPKLSLHPAMRNAKLDSFLIGNGDTKFLDISTIDDGLTDSIIDTYLSLPERTGKQKKVKKTKPELINILRKESNNKFSGNAVLIPRNIRRMGRIYLSNTPVFVSTNFVVINLPNEDHALLLSSWMSTIFYQMICEVSSKDQEGTRKMEVEDILTTLVPNFDLLSAGFIEKIKSFKTDINFLDLQTPHIREIDKLWAAELFGTEATKRTIDAQRLLSFLANRRNT